jgi:hypothetical protein
MREQINLLTLASLTLSGRSMKTHRSILEPIRDDSSWEERWNDIDQGLIACWERGREKGIEDPMLASQAHSGQLVVLPWKGGIERAIKKKQKFGSLFYLAMWQGLRGENLNIDAREEVVLTCTVTGTAVVFTNDSTKYAEA